MDELPPHLTRARDELIAEIRAAFAGVSREGGVSWIEAYEIDGVDDDTMTLLAQSRAHEKDTQWTELIENEEWIASHSSDGCGGYSFLDPIGCRYYLPASMTLSLHQAEQAERLRYHLLRPSYEPEFFENKWSLLDVRQRHCVARFLVYMADHDDRLWRESNDDEPGEIDGGCDWREALVSYWHQFLPP